MSANEEQVGGEHYRHKSIQPWDYIAANGLGFFEGNIVRYVSRWKEKGGVRDLEKARHYIDKLIELSSDALQSNTITVAAIDDAFEKNGNGIVVLKKVKRGRKPKAQYGLKADGTPYLRRPRNWKE
jgi:hypothetical protein